MNLRRFSNRTRKDQDFAGEIESHLAHEEDANLARGLSPEEARRQAQFVQPPLDSVRFDVLEPLAVHSGCSTIGLAAFIGVSQNVLPVHLVIQSIETEAGRFLRFRVQRRLQLLNTCGG